MDTCAIGERNHAVGRNSSSFALNIRLFPTIVTEAEYYSGARHNVMTQIDSRNAEPGRGCVKIPDFDPQRKRFSEKPRIPACARLQSAFRRASGP